MAQETYSEGQGTNFEGEGWLVYASVMLIIVGTLNFFHGLALIANDQLLVTGPDAQVVLVGDVSTWGWVILILGILEFFAGFGVIVRQQWARWFGIIVASLALLAQFPVFFGPHPLWSLTVVILISLVLYGLAAYGGKDSDVTASY
jgi:hypothetical protein